MLGLKRPVRGPWRPVFVLKKKKKKELQARKCLTQDHPAWVEVEMQEKGRAARVALDRQKKAACSEPAVWFKCLRASVSRVT